MDGEQEVEIEHIEGTSYLFSYARTFGSRFGEHAPLRFPDAGGPNPYEPEREYLRVWAETDPAHDSALDHVGGWFAVHVYDVLCGLPERSRGLDKAGLIAAMKLATAGLLDSFNDVRPFVYHCLKRGCELDGTIEASSPMNLRELEDAKMEHIYAWSPNAPDSSGDLLLDNADDAHDVYFNLSPRERARLRRLRRMPVVLARRLVLKNPGAVSVEAQRLLFARQDAPASDALFRVVVGFL
mmetsp:Transcript_443/g.1137  ORF Transcript_443/g.1137 Transcript_443/m.1137 type:complete len:240 (+) Transcript_443:360-1079(+)